GGAFDADSDALGRDHVSSGAGTALFTTRTSVDRVRARRADRRAQTGFHHGLLGALLTTPPARLTISIRGRFRFVVSAVAQRGTLNATRVHAKSSRELREVVRIPGEPKRDRDDACL